MNGLTDQLPPTPQSKKRSRENETDSQRIKREKAAERQRRKRERDRNAGLGATGLVYPPSSDHSHIDIEGLGTPDASREYPGSANADPDLTPEEAVRRDRVRAAARERQRKHRALVKQRKLQQLGMVMGNEVGMPQGEGVHDSDMNYRVPPPDAQYLPPPPPPPPHLDDPATEPPFPHGQGHGGQMFATTLLLSFSCAPLLKQHLLSNLQMTNEELASLEPIIADAWDQWDRQRRQHYEQHGGPPPGTHYDPHPPNTSVPVGVAPSATTTVPTGTLPNGTIPIGSTLYSHPHPTHHGHPHPAHPAHPHATHPGVPHHPHITPDASTADIRARFQRTLVTPTPFQAQAAAAAAAVAAAAAQQTQSQAPQGAPAASTPSQGTPTPTTSVNPANTTSTATGVRKSGGANTPSSSSASSTTTGSEIDPGLGGGVKGES